MKFEVHATVTEVYVVEADDFDQAFEIARDCKEPTYTNSNGFDYIYNTETGEDVYL
jgi:hypothetical protein